jgi:hypothetical protein
LRQQSMLTGGHLGAQVSQFALKFRKDLHGSGATLSTLKWTAYRPEVTGR